MDRTQIFIDGQWTDSASTETIEVIDPTREERIGAVTAGTPADVDRAVAAARAALPGWAATAPARRADLLQAAGERFGARIDELGALIARDVGMPVKLAGPIQIGMPAKNLTAFAELARTYPFTGQTIGNSQIEREPVGVVGAITPWNHPVHQVVLKIGAALAAGCTAVIKPTEVTPLAVYELIDVLAEVGIPPGVVNLVSGYGPVVGQALAEHPGIDMISFTGSTRAGKQVAAAAAANITRVALELGGKSANLILGDADFDTAVVDGVRKCFLNAGQTCSALTRMIVPKDRIDEVTELAVEAARGFVPGDPLDPATMLGPLVSDTQRRRVIDYIAGAEVEGAKIALDGRKTEHDRGYFVGPTVLTGVRPEMTVAREEVFGPVLSILGADDEEEAIAIANDSDYGLSGAVWSADQDRAVAVARRLRTGQVDVNGGRFNAAAPFGGYKHSGIGREGGIFGLEEFTEIKSMQL